MNHRLDEVHRLEVVAEKSFADPPDARSCTTYSMFPALILLAPTAVRCSSWLSKPDMSLADRCHSHTPLVTAHITSRSRACKNSSDSSKSTSVTCRFLRPAARP
eukprot:761074-Hanusia_phi.AAC.2